MLRRLAVAAAVLVAPAAQAAAQGAGPAACLQPPPVVGDAEHPLHLTVSRVERNAVVVETDAARRAALNFVLQEVGSRLRLPEHLAAVIDPTTVLRQDPRVADWPGTVVTTGYARSSTGPISRPPAAAPPPAGWKERRDSTLRAGVDAWPVVRTQLRFTLHADGRVTRAALARGSVLPALDSALAAAVHESGEARGLAGALAGGGAGADSVDLAIDLTVDDDSLGVAATLARVRLPHFRVSPAIARFPESRYPRYPDAARQRGLTGFAYVSYVVSADGRYAPGSLRARGGAAPFLGAVVAAAPDLRFDPATSGGCAVAVEVRQRYVFDLVR